MQNTENKEEPNVAIIGSDEGSIERGRIINKLSGMPMLPLVMGAVSALAPQPYATRRYVGPIHRMPQSDPKRVEKLKAQAEDRRRRRAEKLR